MPINGTPKETEDLILLTLKAVPSKGRTALRLYKLDHLFQQFFTNNPRVCINRLIAEQKVVAARITCVAGNSKGVQLAAVPEWQEDGKELALYLPSKVPSWCRKPPRAGSSEVREAAANYAL